MRTIVGLAALFVLSCAGGEPAPATPPPAAPAPKPMAEAPKTIRRTVLCFGQVCGSSVTTFEAGGRGHNVYDVHTNGRGPHTDATFELAPDGTRFGPGQKVVTPTVIRAELIAEARLAEYDGLMSNVAAFKTNLVVEIDDNNPNRVNVLWPPTLMGQLRDFDVLAQFRLLYPTISLT